MTSRLSRLCVSARGMISGVATRQLGLRGFASSAVTTGGPGAPVDGVDGADSPAAAVTTGGPDALVDGVDNLAAAVTTGGPDASVDGVNSPAAVRRPRLKISGSSKGRPRHVAPHNYGRRTQPVAPQTYVQDEDPAAAGLADTPVGKRWPDKGDSGRDPMSGPDPEAITVLADFLDISRSPGTKPVVGRAWEDLHKLWYILLKERNLLATELALARAQGRRMERPDRRQKVRVTMARLKHVLTERARAEPIEERRKQIMWFINAL